MMAASQKTNVMNDNNLEMKKVRQAISVVRQLLELKKKDDKGKELFEDDEHRLLLEVNVKKMLGSCSHLKTIKIQLPHPYIDESTDLALIVKDVNAKDKHPDHEETIRHYEDLLGQLKITEINKVIPFHQLKVENITAEAKSHFMALYDFLVVDSRIFRLLPGTLGKSLMKKRNWRQVNMKPSKLKNEIKRELRSTNLHIPGYGNNCSVQIGRTDMTDRQLVKNILAVEKRLKESLPGGFNNVRAISLTADDIMTIPIYVDLRPRNDVVFPVEQKVEAEAEEVDTVVGAKVRVNSDFSIDLIKQDDMDSDVDVELDNDDEPKKKKAKTTANGKQETVSSKEEKNEEVDEESKDVVTDLADEVSSEGSIDDESDEGDESELSLEDEENDSSDGNTRNYFDEEASESENDDSDDKEEFEDEKSDESMEAVNSAQKNCSPKNKLKSSALKNNVSLKSKQKKFAKSKKNVK